MTFYIKKQAKHFLKMKILHNECRALKYFLGIKQGIKAVKTKIRQFQKGNFLKICNRL